MHLSKALLEFRRNGVGSFGLRVSLGVLCVWLSGCVVGPDYVSPDKVGPDLWHQELLKGLGKDGTHLHLWWRTLDDAALNSLIERARKGNLDLKVAVVRIREAWARRGIASGQWFPDVNAGGFYSREQESKNALRPSAAGRRPDRTNLHNIGVDASWEIDVFGRISRSVESADASLGASVEDYRDVMVSLYGEVARNYVEVRSLQKRIEYNRGNIEAQRRTLQLTRDRLAAQIAPELDVHQAQLNLAKTESFLPVLQYRLVQTINRLGVLLGEHPGALHEELARSAPIPTPPTEIIVGLPLDLLRQRPDIRRAERELAAQTARIGVATADLYPRFSLSGVFALEGTQLRHLGNLDSRAWSFGPAFSWNLFDGDRIRSNIEVEDALAEQARVRYEQTVLLALEEVESAMVAYVRQSERTEVLQRSVVAAEKSTELVTILYKAGMTNFQNVLDMEEDAFQQQDQLAQSQGRVVQNLIRIYTSLGGGWDVNVAADVPGDPAP